jgi:hypothetical protein
MHGFNHLPTSGIRLVLTRCVFHLERFKDLLHFFKIYERSTKLQDPKNSNKLNLHLLSIVTSLTHTILAMVFRPPLTHNHLFLACLLSIDMKYCPTTHPRCGTLHFCLLASFCKLSNFGTNNFSQPSISLHTLHQTIINFPSHPIIASPLSPR